MKIRKEKWRDKKKVEKIQKKTQQGIYIDIRG